MTAWGITDLVTVVRYAMSGAMAGTRTLGAQQINKKSTNKQGTKELLRWSGETNVGTDSQLNAAAQDFIPCGNQHCDGS